MKYHYNPPGIIKSLFNDFKWETSNRKILLTFDDGPTREATEIILTELNKLKIKAAFFCVGNNVNKYQELTKNIIEEGHLVCNHTFNHVQLTQISYEESKEEIFAFNNLMKENFDYDVKYFRPPHGKFKLNTNKLIKEYNLKNIMWSLLTYDFRNDFKIVKFAVDKYFKRNSIIVLHDSKKSVNIIKDSINYIVERTGKEGFETGEPAECLK